MKHLVLYYDKHKPSTPQTKTFETPDEMHEFIKHKLHNGGTVCYEYSLAHKYVVETQLVKTQL